MKITKRLLIGLMCLIMTLSAGTVFVSAANQPKAQPKVKSATSSTITLSWGKINGAGGYYVYRSVDGKWKKIDDTKKLTYTFKGLIASETYKFAVRHYTVKNNKKTLAKSFGTVTGKTKALSKVANFAATTNDDSITLSWKKLSGATGYRIYIKNESGKWEKLATLGSSTTKYNVKKTSAFNKINFRIRPYAKTSKGIVWGSYSSCSAPINKNTAPVLNVTSVNATDITLNWNSVKDAEGYYIYCLDENKNYKLLDTVYGEDNVTCKADNLSSSTEYTFIVRAFKGEAKGLTSESVTATTDKASFETYRAAKVSKLLNSKEFYIAYSEESETYGKVNSVMALRMGKLYLKEVVNGVSTEYIYDTASDEVYIIDSANKKYRIPSDSEEYDVLLAALHEHMKIEGMGEVSPKYKNGQPCECFTESKYGRYMELSFEGKSDALSQIYIKYADGKESTITVSELKEETDPSLFEIPAGYTKA